MLTSTVVKRHVQLAILVLLGPIFAAMQATVAFVEGGGLGNPDSNQIAGLALTCCFLAIAFATVLFGVLPPDRLLVVFGYPIAAGFIVASGHRIRLGRQNSAPIRM